MNTTDHLNIGDVVTNSIGSGHDYFWQITKKTAKSITVRRISDKIIKQSTRSQTMSIEPATNKFLPPKMQQEYKGGYKEGKPVFRKVDQNQKRLIVKADGTIGPQVRLQWWSLYEGGALKQYSQ